MGHIGGGQAGAQCEGQDEGFLRRIKKLKSFLNLKIKVKVFLNYFIKIFIN